MGKSSKYKLAGDSTGVGNGTDDHAALQHAIDSAANGVVVLPKAIRKGYRIRDTLNIANPITIIGNGAVIFFDFPTRHATGKLFNITASQVYISGLTVDGAGQTGTPKTNRYCFIVVGAPGAHLSEVYVRNCRFYNMDTGFFIGSKPGTTSVCHAVYMDYVDNCAVEGCTLDAISGSFSFLRRTTATGVRNNTIKDTGWYSIHYDGGNSDFEICGNTVKGSAVGGRYWGASIDLMGDIGLGGDSRGRIHHNYVTGVHSYLGEGAVRLSSSSYVEVDNNIFDQINNGNDSNVVTVLMRTVNGSPYQAAPLYIDIHNNIFIPKGLRQRALYAVNGQSSGGGTGAIGLAQGLKFCGNNVISTDASNHFQGVFVHGEDGGWDDVMIQGNTITGSPSTTPVQGLIGVDAQRPKTVTNLKVLGNTLRFVDGTGGFGGTSSQSGLWLGDQVAQLRVQGNSFEMFFFHVYTHSLLAVAGLMDNSFGSNRSHNVQANGVNIDTLKIAPTLNFGGGYAINQTRTVDLTIIGARAGDEIIWGAPANWPDAVLPQFKVSSNDNVHMAVTNATGGAVADPGAGVWYIEVRKPTMT
jgi:hypothetical protein